MQEVFRSGPERSACLGSVNHSAYLDLQLYEKSLSLITSCIRLRSSIAHSHLAVSLPLL